jgi:hypothetical protein
MLEQKNLQTELMGSSTKKRLLQDFQQSVQDYSVVHSWHQYINKTHIPKKLQNQKYSNFNVQQEARKQRQKITGLEKATFGGQIWYHSRSLSTRSCWRLLNNKPATRTTGLVERQQYQESEPYPIPIGV